jgi:hypothetical protein
MEKYYQFQIGIKSKKNTIMQSQTSIFERNQVTKKKKYSCYFCQTPLQNIWLKGLTKIKE